MIPREFIPSVDKGIRDTLPNGIVAGYPVVDVRVRLIFGSSHDVDSSQLAFELAASQAFKEGMRKANPALLEPIMAVEVETPEEYMGDVMGDLNRRRGVVLGMDDDGIGGKKSPCRSTSGRNVRLFYRPAFCNPRPRYLLYGVQEIF